MNNVEIRLGEVAVSGRVQGLWNKDNKAFEVKRGMTKNEKKYQIFELAVSSKDQEGNWTNGKGLKIMLWGETPVNHGDTIAIKGRLQPDNWTNNEGKTMYGLMMNAFDTDMFTANEWVKKEEGNSQSENKSSEGRW